MEKSNAEFKDRKSILVVFGVIEIIFGLIALLFSVLIAFSLLVGFSNSQPEYQSSVSSVIISIFMYLFISAILIALGIGSIQAKRWARSLSLLFSWFTLVMGILIIITFTFFLSGVFDQLQNLEQANPGIMTIVKLTMFLFFTVFFIIVPGIFILFYQSKNVIKTVEKYDEKERWTDKCALPVLAFVLIFLYASILPLFYISYNWIFPFFGTILTGFPALLLWLINSAICIYLAIQFYNSNLRGWYYSIAYYSIMIVSSLITFSLSNFEEVYYYMGIHEKQIEMLHNMDLLNSDKLYWMILLFAIPFFIYLLYIKKYFIKTHIDAVNKI